MVHLDLSPPTSQKVLPSFTPGHKLLSWSGPCDPFALMHCGWLQSDSFLFNQHFIMHEGKVATGTRQALVVCVLGFR